MYLSQIGVFLYNAFLDVHVVKIKPQKMRYDQMKVTKICFKHCFYRYKNEGNWKNRWSEHCKGKCSQSNGWKCSHFLPHSTMPDLCNSKFNWKSVSVDFGLSLDLFTRKTFWSVLSLTQPSRGELMTIQGWTCFLTLQSIPVLCTQQL